MVQGYQCHFREPSNVLKGLISGGATLFASALEMEAMRQAIRHLVQGQLADQNGPSDQVHEIPPGQPSHPNFSNNLPDPSWLWVILGDLR